MTVGLKRILRNRPKHLLEQNIRPVFLTLEGSLKTFPPHCLQRYNFFTVKNTFKKTEFHNIIKFAEDGWHVSDHTIERHLESYLHCRGGSDQTQPTFKFHPKPDQFYQGYRLELKILGRFRFLARGRSDSYLTTANNTKVRMNPTINPKDEKCSCPCS